MNRAARRRAIGRALLGVAVFAAALIPAGVLALLADLSVLAGIVGIAVALTIAYAIRPD